MNRFKKLWSNLRSSFWFLPSLIVLASIVLAIVLIDAASSESERWLGQWPRLFGAGADGARGMMSTIAGSMMTVVGVTFSMILVVLAQASTQYTSRILRNFMRDRVTQVVLGIFAGIFTFSLIVLRTIRGGDEGAFVPSLAVFFGFVLALGGVGTLVLFIHHIAGAIQASSIIASVAQETLGAVDRLFPDTLGQGPGEDDDGQVPRAVPGRKWHVVPARENGYIQHVNNMELLNLACQRRTIVRMERGIGEFVIQETALASLALEAPPDQATIASLQAAFSISRHRTVQQDAAFGIRQIVDVALKALSPGINDHTTAVMCVDYLTAILARLATRQVPLSHRYDEAELRVIAKGPSYESLLILSFDEIRRSANGNVVMMTRLADALQTLADMTTSPQRQRAIRAQVGWLAELVERSIESGDDRATIGARLARVRETLKAGPSLRATEDQVDWRQDNEERHRHGEVPRTARRDGHAR